MKKFLVSILLVLILVSVMVTPALAANEYTKTATVTVNEVVSITLTDAGAEGINFGSVPVSGTDYGDVAQFDENTPAVTVTVGSENTVNVDIGIKGVTSAPGTINWKYSTSFAETPTTIPTTYSAVYTSKTPETIAKFFHWVNITPTLAGDYTCTVYYKAVKTGTGF